ncbi:response regulator [Thiobacillus denitrificans]|uniref:phosphorylase family protein n=1 Tax=Thiobacillus denitrificans TaxID=36861 RepID=UPI000361BD84|nr:response regulator [Thiobacillus denitrificans]
MKILVVDDEQEKRRLIAEALLSVPGIADDNIEYATDVITAKRAIKKTRFELIILDINLPPRPESRIAVGAGLDVLRFIKESTQAKAPAYLFGLTAHDDAAAIAATEFSSPLWKLVRFSYGDSEWRAPLQEAIAYLQKLAKPPFVSDGSSFHTDLGIFVALEDEELSSILGLDGDWSEVQVAHDHARYYIGRFAGSKGALSIVATAAPRMGMPAAAVAASKLIYSFRPRIVAIAGICAGVRGKTEIGDILVADPCFDWGAGKWIKNSQSGFIQFRPAAYQWRLDEALRVGVRTVAEMPGLLARIHGNFQGAKPDSLPKVIIDAMASGASVLQTSATMEDVREQHKNLVGIEMESYAVFTAAEYSPEPRPKCIAIKSVCDFGDEEKTDTAHAYAAHTSAAFLYEFAINYLSDDGI